MNIRITRGSVYFVLAFLFIVAPLVMLAVDFPNPSDPPLLTANNFKITVEMRYEDRTETIPWDGKAGAFWVSKGVPVTMKVEAKAPLVGDGREPIANRQLSSQGVVCSRSWNSDSTPQSLTTGTFSKSQFFYLGCVGLGAGGLTSYEVRVGTVDLTIPTAPSAGLEQKQGASDKTVIGKAETTFGVGVKNAGNVATPQNFKVTLSGVGLSTVMGPSDTVFFTELESKIITILDPGKTENIEFKRSTTDNIGSPNYWYYKFCVDTTSVISESNVDGTAESVASNCKIIGPYKFVAL